MIFKIILCGDSSSGKTAWMQKVENGSFIIGMDNVTKIIDGDKLQIFDTAGQEGFRHLAFPRYKIADGIILMCNLARDRSFHEIDRRYDDILQNCVFGTPVYLIAATHADLASRRIMSDEQLYAFALSKGIDRSRCFVASAQTEAGVPEIIQQIHRDLRSQVQMYMNMYGVVERSYSLQQFKNDYLAQYTNEIIRNENSRMLQMINNEDIERRLSFHAILNHTGGRTRAVLQAAGINVQNDADISADGKHISWWSVSSDIANQSQLNNRSLNSLLSMHAEIAQVHLRTPAASTIGNSIFSSANVTRNTEGNNDFFEDESAEFARDTERAIARSLSDTQSSSSSDLPSNTNNHSILSVPAAIFSSSQSDSSELVGDQKKHPHEYLCPISFEIMQDPVILETGQTYERKNILKWFQSNNTCPSTGIRLKSKALIPNVALRQAIEAYRSAIATTSTNNTVINPQT